MRKQTKLVAVLSATALLAMGVAMTSFAATGWQEEAGTWVYYDSDGEMVTNTWEKSANGDWYYLDEDGYMATDKKVDDYYVDESGKMAKNAWAELAAEDVDDNDPDSKDTLWYYFGSNGKFSTSWKSINGAWYFFNDEGVMQTGWHDDDAKDAIYYLGEDNDGAMKTEWQYLEERNEDDDTNSEPADSEHWYNFGTNGKLVTATSSKKINGKYYAFDEDGIMLTGWVDTKVASEPNAIKDEDRKSGLLINEHTYFNDDGSRASKWLKLSTLADMDTNKWYYFKDGKAYYASTESNKGNGTVVGYKTTNDVPDTTKPVAKVTIDGKIFAFDKDGKMLSGLQELYKTATSSSADAVFYFSNSADTDGSMKTGKQNVYDEDDNETYVYYFDTKASTKGYGITGEKDGYLYDFGKRKDADKGSKYQEVTVDEKDYLVSENGKIKTSGTVKDGDDRYYSVGKKKDGTYAIGQGDTKLLAEAALKALLDAQ